MALDHDEILLLKDFSVWRGTKKHLCYRFFGAFVNRSTKTGFIHHLQSKHKFHPRPDSPLHLSYEEYVLGYLKFSAKGTKREGTNNRSKAGEVKKKRKPKSSLQLIDEFVDEGILVNEPRFDDEEADMQKAVEESLKDVHAAHRGPLPPVVFREPDSGRRQPLPEVQGQCFLTITKWSSDARPGWINPGDVARAQPQ
ncbi:hypothetical protein Tco_0193725 [Tanacetum coccineum]